MALDDRELDTLLLAMVGPRFLKIARILADAHGLFDDWSKPAMQRSVDRLIAMEKKGLVEIVGNPVDPRASEVRLRATGRDEPAAATSAPQQETQ